VLFTASNAFTLLASLANHRHLVTIADHRDDAVEQRGGMAWPALALAP